MSNYSGTVGQTVVTVQQFIDQSARHSGKLAEELTVEQVQGAKQALYMILSNLINQGINYWAIEKKVYGLQPNQYEYLLPVGGNDVLNALYRSIFQPIGSYSASDGSGVNNIADDNVQTYNQMTVANGSYEVNYGTNNPQYIGSIGFMPYISGGGSSVWNYKFQSSTDGSTWNTLYTGTSVAVTDGEWVWQDIDPGANVQYYRMLATDSTILALRELYFGVNTTEITMSRLNRDDYTNLPNKNFTANQPFQYWLNRTIPQAKITLWPTPSNAFYQMTIWYSRQVMDVGDLSGELEIPQYAMQAIQMMLSHQVSMILPGVDLAKIQYLEAQAEKYFIMMENENRDRSPIYFSPNISCYTR